MAEEEYVYQLEGDEPGTTDVTDEEFMEAVGQDLQGSAQATQATQATTPAEQVDDIVTDAQARDILFGSAAQDPSYLRVYQAPINQYGFARVMYMLNPQSYRRTDRTSASSITTATTSAGVARLIDQAYQHELNQSYPGTVLPQRIHQAFCKVQANGLVQAQSVYFDSTIMDKGLEHTVVLNKSRLLDESVQETTSYDVEYKYGVSPDDLELYPNSFGFLIYNDARAPLLTPVRGLTAHQLGKIQALKKLGDLVFENLDKTGRGYCLFETIAKLSDIPFDKILEECGNPPPNEVFVENCANTLANLTRINFSFIRLGPDKLPTVFYRTQTSFFRDEQLLVLSINDVTQKNATFKHIFHVVPPTKKDPTVMPYENETIMINIDLEGVCATNCENQAYGLNLLAYRVSPSVESTSMYNPQDLASGLQCYNTTTGLWHEMLEMKDGVRQVSPIAQASAIVMLDGDLDVLKHLIPFLMDLRMRIKTTKVTFVLVGYYSSHYDNFILIPYLKNKLGFTMQRLKVGIFGNSILTYSIFFSDPFTEIITWDLRRHLVGSLRGNCRDWAVPCGGEKGDLDHKLIQTIYMMNPTKFNDFLEANKDDNVFTLSDGSTKTHKGIITYCKQDVIASAILHYTYKTSIEFIVNQYFIKTHGATMAMISKLQAPHPVPYEYRGNYLRNITLPTRLKEIIYALSKFDESSGLKLEYDMKLAKQPLNAASTTIAEADFAKASADPEYLKQLIKESWEMIGGKLKGFNPNIEAFPTLAGFATKLFNMICQSKGITQVQGFAYEITKALRELMCIAGRSQSNIGIHEDEPIALGDIVSLYPTAMICGVIQWAIGCIEDVPRDTMKAHDEPEAKQKTSKKRRVNCSYVTSKPNLTPVEGQPLKLPAGIWKVVIKSQPNGIVMPPKSKKGYHWMTNIHSDIYRLVTTPDLVSLDTIGADYKVVDGIVFNDTDSNLYQEYISIASSEKNRQDRLAKKDTTIAIFPNEKYNPGIREACKLIMNILSGKEITKPYLVKREIYDSEITPHLIDFSNSQQQYVLASKAKRAFDKNNLFKWRTYVDKIKHVPRLSNDVIKLGPNTFVATWRSVPVSGKFSHINGYHIYGMARLIMNKIYSQVLFSSVFLTETDSLAIGLSALSKLYSMKSVFGQPLLVADGEYKLGLLPEPEKYIPCNKPKEFGQLELELTPKLLSAVAKNLGFVVPDNDPIRLLKRDPTKPPKTIGNKDVIQKLYYKDHTLFAMINGVEYDSKLRGPYVACGGKKIYAIYLRDENNKQVFIKARFKGLTIKEDWVIDIEHQDVEPDLYKRFLLMSRKERICYALTSIGDYSRTDIHKLRKRDIMDFIDKKVIYVIQTRVSENTVCQLLSRQNVIVKKITMQPDAPSVRELQDIHAASEKAKEADLRLMSRGIKSYDDKDDDKCAKCDEKFDVIINQDGYCNEHAKEVPRDYFICQYDNNCGLPALPNSNFCQMHHDSVFKSVTHLPPVNCCVENCKELVTPKEAFNGQLRCSKHSSEKPLSTHECEFVYKRNSKKCSDPISILAVKRGFMLCHKHYSNCSSEERQAYNIPVAKIGELISEYEAAAVQTRIAAETKLCAFITPKTKKVCTCPAVEGSDLCERHRHYHAKKT